jgi:glutamate racemase
MPDALPPTILVFDSGVGGLTVFREMKKARPDASYIYIADDAFFPYNSKPEAELVAHVADVMVGAIDTHAPDLIVLACNTASTIALPALRARVSVPLVGTVPAIKPACAQSKTKRIAVLGTQATVSREYTRALIREFASGCKVALVGSPRLATYAEAELAGAPVTDAEIAAEILPCFLDEDGDRTDTIVLACTHYPLLLARFARVAPWPVEWIDPAPAIARRAADLLRNRPQGASPGTQKIAFTSGRITPPPALAKMLATFGF